MPRSAETQRRLLLRGILVGTISINSLGLRGPSARSARRRERFASLASAIRSCSAGGQTISRFSRAHAPFARSRSSFRTCGTWQSRIQHRSGGRELRRDGRTAWPDLVLIGWVGNDMDLPNFLVKRPDPWSLDRPTCSMPRRVAQLRVTGGLTKNFFQLLVSLEASPRSRIGGGRSAATFARDSVAVSRIPQPAFRATTVDEWAPPVLLNAARAGS
jgi:hypothetical protein